MSRLKILLGALISGLVLSISVQAATTYTTPEGFWKTVDDTTGQPKSIVQIWKTKDQVLMGKVVKLFPEMASNQVKVCKECSGELHNQPIVGMVILSGLKANENQWRDGKILDPANGKSYSCSLKLGDAGKRLNVHGYIGLPMLGRSQTWERVDLMSEA